jgi:hypothetical protein
LRLEHLRGWPLRGWILRVEEGRSRCLPSSWQDHVQLASETTILHAAVSYGTCK